MQSVVRVNVVSHIFRECHISSTVHGLFIHSYAMDVVRLIAWTEMMISSSFACVQFIAGLFKEDGGQEGGGASSGSRRRAPTIASRFSESLDKLIAAMSR